MLDDKTVKELEEKFSWEKDPLVFIFHNEIPGKVRMHTKRLDMKDWVRIDRTYPAQMKLRQEILRDNRSQVVVTDDDEPTMEAKQELLEKLIDYLPQRFPDLFETREAGIYNKVLQEFISSDINDGGDDPIIRCGRLTQEDWVIIQYDEKIDGYKLTAGVVYFPMRWSLLEKYTKGIPAIHQPVESFQKHLKNNVQSLFARMTASAPVWRANWAVFNDLAGPLDLHSPTGHDDRNEVNQVTQYCGEETGNILTFRAEYQTLLKLPKTGAIVFSIRTYQRYLNDFHNFPVTDAKALVLAIETLDQDNYVYKGTEFWKDAAVAYLNQIIKEKSDAAQSSLLGNLLNTKAILSVCAVTLVGTILYTRYLRT